MRLLIRLTCLILLSWLGTRAAEAADFKNIGSTPVIMYDAPSPRGQKLFIAPRGMPVEVVINYGTWSKVRDITGDLCWVETKQLSERKNIVVRSLNAKVHNTADDASGVVFSADKGVLLELVEPASSGWAKVRHTDGSIGFVKLGDVWGL